MKPPNGKIYWLDIGEFEPYVDRRGRTIKSRPVYRTSGVKRLYRARHHAVAAQRYQRAHGYPNAELYEGVVTWSPLTPVIG